LPITDFKVVEGLNRVRRIYDFLLAGAGFRKVLIHREWRNHVMYGLCERLKDPKRC